MLKQGVHVEPKTLIEKVSATHVHIKGRRRPVPYGILLWVAGNKSVPLVSAIDVAKTQHGLIRILTDSSLRVRKN